jgi:predicted nucleic-acid-binding Zn-ribbon protein
VKQTHACPKCEHRRVWHIDEVTETAHGGTLVPLSVTVDVGKWTGLNRKGRFELYICQRCGYAEWYAKQLEELKSDPKRGIRLIEAPDGDGPKERR